MNFFSAVKKPFIKKILSTAITSTLAVPALAAWTVQDGKLLDPNGNHFVFRGVTIDHTLAPDKTLRAIADAAAMGANAVQVEIAGNYWNRWHTRDDELRNIIQACKDHKVVCVLEANDVAGYPMSPESVTFDYILNYWNSPFVREVISGQEDYIIISMGNQYVSTYPDNYSVSSYLTRMDSYVRDFKSSLKGFVIVVDGNLWGQDTDLAMHALAKLRQKDNPLLDNILYSVDMFDAYPTPEKVRGYISAFSELGAPLVIGGFAPAAYYHPHFTGAIPLNAPRLPVEAVMQYSEEYGAGYFGWSWSGNKNSALDIVTNWTAASLTPWGDVLFNDVNGIKATAKRASIFANSSSSAGNSSSSTSTSSVAANQAPVAKFTTSYTVGCAQATFRLTAADSYDPDGDELSYEWNGRPGGVTTEFIAQSGIPFAITLKVTDSKGASTSVSHNFGTWYFDNCSSRSNTSTSSSTPIKTSSSTSLSSSSIKPSSASSSSRTSSSIGMTKASCSYVVNNQWGNGFTATIRIKNTSNAVINGWDVNWHYADGSKVTNLWNASLSGANPYTAKNLNWNTKIQPGQTVEFGFQGSKPSGAASIPVVSGSVCQ